MFGTTIEYLLRENDSDHLPPQTKILSDGSMHSYRRECHIWNWDSFESVFGDDVSKYNVITPLYPANGASLSTMLEKCSPHFSDDHKWILIHADSLEYAEINILYQYYKIAEGDVPKKGLGLFCGDNRENIVHWNRAYTHWSDMQTWELREWLSLFYVEWTKDWLIANEQTPDNFLKISTREILCDTARSFKKILIHAGKTVDEDKISTFSSIWRTKQEYVIEKYKTINDIINTTLNQDDFMWNKLTIIEEAIIQQKLRALGYEIQCDGLNEFPQNSLLLSEILYKTC